MALSVESALLANWIGPPKRAYFCVFSYSVTSKPALSMASDVVSPPTPPPAMTTFSGGTACMHGTATHRSESRAGAAVGPVIVLDDGIDHVRMSGMSKLIILLRRLSRKDYINFKVF